MYLWNKKKHFTQKQIGRYRILAIAGEGRYGICYLAEDQNNRKVVIKRFKKKFGQTDYRAQLKEADILLRLRCARIPKLLDVINQPGFYGFVLEKIEGDTLKERLFQKRQEFRIEEITLLGLQLISLIHFLQTNNIVHRDISISNLIIQDNQLYLIDFGLAQSNPASMAAFHQDYTGLGDVMLFLLYSSEAADSCQKRKFRTGTWYQELNLSSCQMNFLKKLFGILPFHTDIEELKLDYFLSFCS